MSRARLYLDTPDGKRHFPPGSYLIGRAEECEVVLASGRCSRHHARLTVSAESVTLEDLASANGTFVNGAKIVGTTLLANGDFVVVGGEIGIEVLLELDPEVATPAAPNVRASSADRDSRPYLPPTAKVATDEILERAADHLLANGQHQQAERTLERWLTTALAAAKSGEWREDTLIEMSLRCAAKLAKALRSRRWVDYALELSTAVTRPLSLENANLLNDAIDAAGVSLAPLSRYASMLRGLSATPEIARAMDEAEAWHGSTTEEP